MISWFNVDSLGEQGCFWTLPATPHLHPGPACLQAASQLCPYIHVNHGAGPQLGKQLLVIRSNWKIQTGGVPSSFVLKHLFSV